MTQAVLPKIRAAKGRIVFISSVSGLITTPGTGALLRLEVRTRIAGRCTPDGDHFLYLHLKIQLQMQNSKLPLFYL